ncbi:hypothetical protein PEC301937_18540 [Pectobacterium carotovorum subsp. carotovorum]|nr:hypothetical protein PEC301937_18540 [Pectobacterium carotovorum subsp. carotovorum]
MPLIRTLVAMINKINNVNGIKISLWKKSKLFFPLIISALFIYTLSAEAEIFNNTVVLVIV